MQIAVGDWAAHFVAEHQPVKLAAIEGVYETERGRAAHAGRVSTVDGELRYAVEIPNGLSLLAHWDPDAVVRAGPRCRRTSGRRSTSCTGRSRPWWRSGSRCSLLGRLVRARLVAPARPAAVARGSCGRPRWPGSAAVVALEAGWITTEVGRQPWIVYGLLRTADAVNPAPGLRSGCIVVTAVYAVLTVGHGAGAAPDGPASRCRRRRRSPTWTR